MCVWPLLCLAVLLTPSLTLAADRTLVMVVEKPRSSFVTKTYFDDMAGSAGTVAGTKDSADDVSCGLTFLRSGDIIEHQTLPKEITTRTQLNQISALPVDIFVMDQLSVCGQYENEPAVAGCERPGPILVEAGSLAHLTLVHEVGHRSGLSHATPRAQCEDDPGLTLAPLAKKNNIMFCRRHANRKWMTTGNCNTIKATSHFSEDADLVGDAAGQANIEAGPLPSISAIQELLAGLFGEGIDFAAIQGLTEAQLDAIRAELRGGDHRFWEQAAYVLGIRGSAEDLAAIVALAHRAANIPTPEGYRARSAVPEAIGMYLAYHQDEAGLDWLKTFLLSNVSTENVRMLGDEDETALLANRYAQGAALAGDLGLALSTIDILAAQQADDEVQERVAARALAAQDALPHAVVAGDAQVTANAIEELRSRSNAIEINPAFVDILRDEGLVDSAAIEQFNQQELGPGVIDLELLDERVQELLVEQNVTQ